MLMQKSYLLILLIFSVTNLCAQKYLVLDKYGINRTRLQEGDELVFKLRADDKIKHKETIVALYDTSLVLSGSTEVIPLSHFHSIFIRRSAPDFLGGSFTFMGSGFLFASAVHPLVGQAQYSQKESAIIGASFLAIGRLVKLFRWKRYKFSKQRSRIRIIDTTIR